MNQNEPRESLASRLGFLLISAACAIGVGNVWKFPWVVGRYGGAAFVLVYLVFLVMIGLPILTLEFTSGRAAQTSPALLFRRLEKPGQHWHAHGWVCLVGCTLLMMFYTTVSGWMLDYFVKSCRGVFMGMTPEEVGATFGAMLGDPVEMTLFMGITVAAAFLILSLGVRKGLENVTTPMMLALLVLIVVLAVNSLFLEGGRAGLDFYLRPSLSKLCEQGLAHSLSVAMNHAFFTLGLGVGSMAIFGSYIKRDHALLGEAAYVAGIDTAVALLAGLIIFPACFAYGQEAGAGPALLFITLPNVFAQMASGRVWCAVFFLFMTFAAFSTVLAVCENIVACTMDLFHWTRRVASAICGVALFVLSLPCLLGFNRWAAFQPFGDGSGVLDLEDFFLTNLILPAGAFVFVFFCATRYGWGWKNFMDEANQGRGLKVRRWMRWYCAYVLPVFITFLAVLGLIDKFS